MTMSERFDHRDADWPARPWIMAAICSVAGVIFYFLGELDSAEAVSALRQAAKAEFDASRGPNYVYRSLLGDRNPPLDFRK